MYFRKDGSFGPNVLKKEECHEEFSWIGTFYYNKYKEGQLDLVTFCDGTAF